MLRTTVSLLCGFGLVVAASGAAAQTPSKPEEPASGRVMTSSDVGKSSIEGAVTTPLRDINILKLEIPPALLHAAANPYAPAPRTCAALRPEIEALNEALGEDFDESPIQKDGTRATAYSLVSTATSSVIPMRGWVRKLSGAEARDQRIQNAILAGTARRSYLKGVGQAKGCKAPSAPHVVASASAPKRK
jgi:hypothetical protein